MSPNLGKNSSFLIIGHRGVPKIAPENSASGFHLAVRLRIPMVELDVRLTRDRELAVIHDNDIRKLSDGLGKVHKSDFRYLRQFDYGTHFHRRFKGEKILKLDEALNILLPKVRVMIELKEDKRRRKELASALVHCLAARKEDFKNIIVCSFSDKLLLEVQNLAPDLWLGLITRAKFKKSFHKALKYGFNSIHPHHRIAKKGSVRSAEENGIKVFIWTVNSQKSIVKLKSQKVDGIITDIPERLLNFV